MDRKKLPISPPKHRRKAWRTYVVGAVAIIIALPIIAVGVFVAQFNPDTYVSQMAAAVQKATGRTLTISGPVHLQLSLTPSLVVNDLTLSNPVGFADPALLTLTQAQAQVALLPLLRHQLDILDLKLVGPTLYLERNAAGQADWIFYRPHNAQAAANTSPAQATTPESYRIALKSVSLGDGQIILRPNTGAQPITIRLNSFTGQATDLATPLHLSGSAIIGTTPLTVQGVVGSVSSLAETNSNPWPVDLTFGFAGASAALQGSIAQPQMMTGYNLHLTAHIPALAAIGTALPAAWLHGTALPPLQNVDASLTVQGQTLTLSALRDLTLKAGTSDLSGLWPGLNLTSLTASLPVINGSGILSASGAVNQLPWLLQAHWKGLDGFFSSQSSPANPADNSFAGGLTMKLGAASASLQGGIATPRTLSGAAWALMLNVPDLSAISPAWGSNLPSWKNIMVRTTLTDPGGQGFLNGIELDNLTTTMANASFGGHGNLMFGARPDLDLTLDISQANLDALRAALPAAPVQQQAVSSQTTSSQTSPAAQQTPALPFALLRRADADITINADQLTYGQTLYNALQTHAVLKNGLLTIAPFTVQLPGGAMLATGSLDANVEPAAETLTINAPALALGPFLSTFNLPDAAQGIVQAQMNVSARGDNWAAMLGSVSGRLGLASVNSEIDGTALNQLLGRALRTAGLPAALVGAPGAVPVRCLALRLDAEDGSGTVRALAFDSSRLLLMGGGSMNFASQTLGLVLEPHIRVGGMNVVIPVAVDGPFQSPHYGVATAAAIAAAKQTSVGLTGLSGQTVSGSPSLLSQVTNALTGHEPLPLDVCNAALPLARMGQAGPAPHALAPTSPSTTTPATSGPRSLLNMLLGQ